jgi:hypothetical protein
MCRICSLELASSVRQKNLTSFLHFNLLLEDSLPPSLPLSPPLSPLPEFQSLPRVWFCAES